MPRSRRAISKPEPSDPPRDALQEALAERDEAIARQAALADVLQIINDSPGDPAPVFDAIVEKGMRLCGADFGGMWLVDGDHLLAVGVRNLPGPYFEHLTREPATASQVFDRATQDRPFIHVADLSKTRSYRERLPLAVAGVELGGVRTLLGVLLRDGETIVGMINLYRQEVKLFADNEIALVRAFAMQAQIAMKNARLFKETQEALEQQKASADVLGAISQSVEDTAPVFEAILGACQRLFGSEEIGIYTIDDDDMVRVAAWRGPRAEEARRDVTPLAESVTGRVIRERRTHHIPDLGAVPNLSPTLRERVDRHGGASLLYAPMLWEERGLGSILVVRWPPRPFSDREQALLQTFADQAAIAIQNARLFNETREALERQTATANVLKVISQSVSDAAPVFETILESCQRLFGLEAVAIYLVEGDRVRGVAHRGWSGGDWGRDETPLALSTTGRAIAERRAIHVPDLAEKPGLPERFIAPLREAGGLTVLYAPMLWEDRGVGSIVVSRKPAKPFSEREIALLQSFADQAAIAIQNARLFNETQEALEHQKASGEVLRAIAQSVADATPVFENILDASQRLFGTEDVCIFTVGEDGMVRPAAVRGPTFSAARNDVMPLEGSRTGRVIRERSVHHIPDGLAEPGTPPAILERMRRSGNVSIAFAPMLWEDSGLGSIAILRSPPRPFSERELELLRGFADQAVIAIQNARMFRETNEALRQQTAMSDILRVIASSPGDVAPVLERLTETACRLCEAYDAVVLLREGDSLRFAAHYGPIPLPATLRRPISREWPPGRAVFDREPVHVHDLAAAQDEYPDAVAIATDAARAASQSGPAGPAWRSVLAAPLMRESEALGAIVLRRAEVLPFSGAQIAQLETFADQAVIAIENARLFEEVRAKTRDLTEALQQQTATAEVLKVISRSAFDLKLATTTILEAAAKLCRAPLATLHLRDGEVCRLVTQFGLPEAFERLARAEPIPVRYPLHSRRPARAGEVAHFSDAWNDPDYLYKATAKSSGYRAIIVIPLMREDELVGIFSLGRPEPEPFTPSQIKLVQTFADQAAIAIENGRLFNEVKTKTDDLSEALQQQTATAEVLKVISRSAFDLDAVLNSLTRSAVELCNSTYGVISLYKDGVLVFMAQTGCTPEFAELLWSHPAQLDRKSATGRTGLLRSVVLIPDVTKDEDYDYHGGEIIGNYRSCLGVPLLRNGELEGVFTLMRREPGPFTPRQVELVQTFADQAVIAIENVRLFNEVQARTHDLTEALRLQTATADVLKVISRSAFDLQAVFETLISSAVELCGADGGTICVRDGEVFPYRASAGAGQTKALTKYLEEHPATPGPGSTAGRVLLSGKVEAIPDCLEDPDYVIPMDSLSQSVRAILGVPLLRNDGVEGALALWRKEPGYFTQRQMQIVQTFADQAVIAIENVRLFEQVQARTRELAASLDDLRKAQDRLIQSEKLASLGQLTAGIAHEIKNPLNFVNNFSALSRELVGELDELIKAAPLEAGQREEAEELIGAIDGNLDKVVQHGKRADSIVKNMLLHSREGSGERSTTNLNALVEEALNLAYHGARAEKPGFNVAIEKSLDPNAGVANLYAQEITRVLLNLISNAFYATMKRNQGELDGAYEPTIAASTRDLGASVEIAIRDNGTGIPDEVKAKMFNPFFTTKPAGEGTGLGLSLSHDIVVKQHGGTIDVSTEPGAFTQFTIVLPRKTGSRMLSEGAGPSPLLKEEPLGVCAERAPLGERAPKGAGA